MTRISFGYTNIFLFDFALATITKARRYGVFRLISKLNVRVVDFCTKDNHW